MKILYIHNNYASNNSGEEHAAQKIVNLLVSKGHIVEWYRRSSDEITDNIIGKAKAFFAGIYNPLSVIRLKKILNDFKPDIVQVQNIYPLISAAIFKAIKESGAKLVMRCPNYRLFCPTGLHLDPKGNVCEACLGSGRELNCIKKNCEKDILKSVGYAIRNYTTRNIWNYKRYVDTYIVQSDFQKQKFIQNGIEESKIIVIPGFTEDVISEDSDQIGTYVSFIGRVSHEKGISEFLEVARLLPNIQFAVAGELDESLFHILDNISDNVKYCGFLQGDDLDRFFKDSKIIVVPSKWYEGFPNVILKAMIYKKPVICSNIGAMSTIVSHNTNGFLIDPFNTTSIKEAIESLYSDDLMCARFGEENFKLVKDIYSKEKVYALLIKAYSK